MSVIDLRNVLITTWKWENPNAWQHAGDILPKIYLPSTFPEVEKLKILYAQSAMRHEIERLNTKAGGWKLPDDRSDAEQGMPWIAAKLQCEEQSKQEQYKALAEENIQITT
jgi:hypothetical protein